MCETNRRRKIIAKIRSGEISCPDTCPIADKCERPKHNCWGECDKADKVRKQHYESGGVKMPNFTKESVHHAFCNLPDEQKMNLAINCAQYGVTPESIENLCAGILKCVEPVINRAIENLKYWSDDNAD